MGCYLEDYRARVGTWAGRFLLRGVSRRGDAIRTAGDCLGLTVLSSVVLAVLLVSGGVGQNPGLLWKGRTPCDFHVLSAAEFFSEECNVNCVDGDIITAVGA